MLALAAEGVRRYDSARHHRFAYTFAGHDAGVCAHCIRAMGLSVAGDTAKIKPELEAAVALSDRLQHPLSLLFAQGIMCNTLYLTHDLGGCRASANEIASARGFINNDYNGEVDDISNGNSRAAR